MAASAWHRSQFGIGATYPSASVAARRGWGSPASRSLKPSPSARRGLVTGIGTAVSKWVTKAVGVHGLTSGGAGEWWLNRCNPDLLDTLPLVNVESRHRIGRSPQCDSHSTSQNRLASRCLSRRSVSSRHLPKGGVSSSLRRSFCNDRQLHVACQSRDALHKIPSQRHFQQCFFRSRHVDLSNVLLSGERHQLLGGILSS